MSGHDGRRGKRANTRLPAGLDRPVADQLEALSRRLADVERLVGEVHGAVVDRGPEKEFYSTNELAQAMGVSVYTVTARWCGGERIECEKDPNSGRWMIPAREFLRLARGGPLRPRQK